MPRPSRSKAQSSKSGATVKARAIKPRDWPDIENLFGKNGACAGCWCMFWRQPKGEWRKNKGEGNRRAFRTLVTEGAAPGIFAFAGDLPVG